MPAYKVPIKCHPNVEAGPGREDRSRGRSLTGTDWTRVAGARAILRQDPKTEPNRTKKSPAPRFHAFSQRIRRELYEAYALFVSAFRTAADKLKAGDRKASFPTGSFPPHLPFVRNLHR